MFCPSRKEDVFYPYVVTDFEREILVTFALDLEVMIFCALTVLVYKRRLQKVQKHWVKESVTDGLLESPAALISRQI